MSEIVFKVYEVKPCCGRIVRNCLFISVFADHAIEEAADLATAHPGVLYQVIKKNVFTRVEVIVDEYRVERADF